MLACHDTAISPLIAEKELASRLSANLPAAWQTDNGPEPDVDAPVAGLFGNSLTVAVSRISENPPLLRVIFNFGIKCGDDSLLLLFERTNDHWEQTLRWEADNYKSIGDAFGDFFVSTIVKPTHAEDWRAVVAHGKPWCSSRWSGFGLDVLAPSHDRNHPRVVSHRDLGYVRFDVEPKMSAAGDTFTLRLQTGSIEGTDLVRPGVFRYMLIGDTLRRIQPIATNGRYFVEEWLQLAWLEASAYSYSDPIALANLKAAHDQFTKNRSSKDPWEYEYGPVRACHDNPKHFQVEFEVSDPHTGDRPVYFQIQENGEGYTMMVADSPRPDHRCTGPDLMKKH